VRISFTFAVNCPPPIVQSIAIAGHWLWGDGQEILWGDGTNMEIF
jgi:hypothetical protein